MFKSTIYVPYWAIIWNESHISEILQICVSIQRKAKGFVIEISSHFPICLMIVESQKQVNSSLNEENSAHMWLLSVTNSLKIRVTRERNLHECSNQFPCDLVRISERVEKMTVSRIYMHFQAYVRFRSR